MLAYWGFNSRLRETEAGLRRVRLMAGLGLLALGVIMALAVAFARAAPGYEQELATTRDHLRYVPALLLFGGLCAGFVAVVHYLARSSEDDGSPLG